MYGLSIVQAPATEPVTLGEAKTHLRVETGDDDAYISSLVSAARMHVESLTQRALITQTLKLTLDHFTGWRGVIYFPRSPIQSVSAVTYTDTVGNSQTLSPTIYRVDTASIVPRIMPAFGQVWPVVLPQLNSVEITFIAGYGDASTVPEPIKQAIKLIIGTLYEHRETVVVGDRCEKLPDAAEYLLGPYRVATVAGADHHEDEQRTIY